MLNRSLSWIAPIAIGATAMYLLDPNVGRRRRARLRDAAINAARKTRDGAAALSCDLQHRAVGLIHEVRGRWDTTPVSDDVLVERVRAELGRVCSHPSAIDVQCRAGEVMLSGQILSSERHPVALAIRRVRGVTGVLDDLEAHETADSVPSLQGGSLRPDQMWLRDWWSPTRA